jgi:hypothetical protein
MAAGAGNDPGYGRTEGRTGRCIRIRKADSTPTESEQSLWDLGWNTYQRIDIAVPGPTRLLDPSDSPAFSQRWCVGAVAIGEESESHTRKDNGNSTK